MIGAPFAYRRTYALPRGFSVEFVLDGLQLTANWLPDMPDRKQTRKLLRHYRRARGEFIRSLGIPTMVIEI